MNSLTLKDLSANAFRTLGLTADASQMQIDAAARKMRIWQEPAMIPGSVNDATWIGPIPRTQGDIENAVARLADPLSRLNERFWWFCLTPPASDALPAFESPQVTSFHDAALIHLYRCLLTHVDGENFDIWQNMIGRFRILAASDDYLQWLFEVESQGDFEKRASLEEIAEAQQQIPFCLSTAMAGSIDNALATGDFAAAAEAVQLVQADRPRAASLNPADELIERMEDHLVGRCNELIGKIDAAWKTRRLAALRPACNHAIARFGAIIQPLIDQLVAASSDIEIKNRARMHGVNLMIHVSKAYEACDNFLASERTLESALKLAANTPMGPTIINLLDKVKTAANRQRTGAPRGQRQQSPETREFKLKPGGKIRGDSESWLWEIFKRPVVWWLLIVAGLGVGRLGCDVNYRFSVPTHPVPTNGFSNFPAGR